MRLPLVLFGALTAYGQSSVPTGILKGDLLEWDGAESTGNLTVRAADHRVFRCSFDSLTYFERERQRAAISSMKAGDRVELVTDDSAPGSNKCYARTVHVLPPARPPIPEYLQRAFRARRTAFIDNIAPRGSLVFAGLVMRRTSEAIWIRTRTKGEKTVLLRQDTRYLSGGSPVEAAALAVNTRVFVRAGRNLENDLEAFQVVWGDILKAQ